MPTLSHVGAEGPGVSLVLIHGFPFDSQLWRGQINALSEHVPVFAPDLPGFGNSPTLAAGIEPSMDAYADTVAAWAREQGIGGLALAGHSMGGYVALAFARKYPFLLRALLLVCTRPGPDSDAAREGRYKLAGEVQERGPQPVVDAMFPKLFAPDGDGPGKAGDTTREMMLRQGKQGIIAALQAMATRPDSTPALREIAVPTLVITGAQDAIIPAADAEAMLSQIPSSRHVAIDKSGHLPMLENPRDFNRTLREFLNEL